MDWAFAIERNCGALMRLVGLAFAAAGLVASDAVQVLTRAARLELLRVLRPAEAAARRLIVLAARGLKLPVWAARPFPAVVPRGAGGAHLPAFVLLDPLRRGGGYGRRAGPTPELRISVIGEESAVGRSVAVPSDDAPVDATRLLRRMAALQRALSDLPREARRLARWRSRRAKIGGPGRVSSLRSGRPPGHRARITHRVDELLRDCHELALLALAPPGRGPPPAVSGCPNAQSDRD